MLITKKIKCHFVQKTVNYVDTLTGNIPLVTEVKLNCFISALEMFPIKK